MSIKSFERVVLSESGSMACDEEWEIVRTEGGAQISRYSGSWNYDDDIAKEDCLQARAVCAAEDVLTILNACEIDRWAGFSGHNTFVLDGYSFSFEATLDGKHIDAHGANSFPAHYRDFKNAVNAMSRGDKL